MMKVRRSVGILATAGNIVEYFKGEVSPLLNTRGSTGGSSPTIPEGAQVEE